MLRYFILTLSVLMFNLAHSQYLSHRYTGELIREIKYPNYKGSPYLFDDWSRSIVSIKGQSYKYVAFNVDQFANVPMYKSNDSLFQIGQSVDSFSLVDKDGLVYYKRGHFLHSSFSSDFVEIMSAAPLLVKRVKIKAAEESSYSSGTKEYRFLRTNEYYMVQDGSVRKLKLTKEEAKAILQDKWQEIEAYAKEKKVSYKTEEGWKELLQYAQTLK